MSRDDSPFGFGLLGGSSNDDPDSSRRRRDLQEELDELDHQLTQLEEARSELQDAIDTVDDALDAASIFTAMVGSAEGEEPDMREALADAQDARLPLLRLRDQLGSAIFLTKRDIKQTQQELDRL